MIDRRMFLRGLAATAAGLFLPKGLVAEAEEVQKFYPLDGTMLRATAQDGRALGEIFAEGIEKGVLSSAHALRLYEEDFTMRSRQRFVGNEMRYPILYLSTVCDITTHRGPTGGYIYTFTPKPR